MDDKQRRMCGSKIKFFTRAAAKPSAKRARQVSGDQNIRPYKCDYCQLFHIGHNSPDPRISQQEIR